MYNGPEATGARTPQRSIRWFPLRNQEYHETIPGFALVALDITDGDEFFMQEVQDGQVVWWGHKPNEMSESLQDAALLCVNGPTPILPGRIGKCTFDWPAQVLHNGAVDDLPNGRGCGPKADSWYVWSDREAFTCQGHDAARGQDGGAEDVHTAWISPARVPAPPRFRSIGIADTYAPNAKLLLSPDTGENLKGFSLVEGTGGYTEGIKCLFTGIVQLNVSATLSADVGEAEESDVLRYAVYRQRLQERSTTTYQTAEATYLTAHREFEIDSDILDIFQLYGVNPYATKENVATGGWLDVQTGDILTIRNVSAVPMLARNLVFAGYRIGTTFVDNTGRLTYP